VKTPIRLCAAALEWSSSEVSSGILIRRNYKKKKEPRRTEQDISRKTLAAPEERKKYIYICGK
jgi:hypothetical protein